MKHEIHFLEVVNKLSKWHFFSKIQKMNVTENNVSLLSTGQEEVMKLNPCQAQHIFIAVCQRMAEQESSLISFELDDIKQAMLCDGHIWMSCITASGEKRAEEIAFQALNHARMPKFSKAKMILCNIYGHKNLQLEEYEIIASMLRDVLKTQGIIKIGLIFDNSLVDAIQMRLMAFGCE